MNDGIAYCGLNCTECPAFIATRDNNLEKIRALATEWSTESLKFEPDDILCDGCTKHDERLFKWGYECGIRICCSAKGHPNCSHCECLPCDEVEKAPAETKARLLEMRDAIGDGSRAARD